MHQQRKRLPIALAVVAIISCSDQKEVEDDSVGAYGTVSQAWSMPMLLVNRLSGVCIDVIGAPGRASTTPLQTYPCERTGKDAWGGPSDQYWQWDSETGFISNNLTPSQCLDVTGAPGTANGAPLQLYNCERSGYDRWGNVTDQAWTMRSDGFIVNRLSGKCIDVAGAPGATNHLPLWLWDCESSGVSGNGAPTDQKWDASYYASGGRPPLGT
jgi:hypothetical protein